MQTVAELWASSVARASPEPAFLEQTSAGWRPVSWADAAATVGELAAGFLALGVGKGDRVAILSRTRLEWTLCDYALASIGAVSVTIYPTSSDGDVAYILEDSGARVVVCETRAQAARLPAGERELVTMDGAAGLPLAELRRRGAERLATDPDAVERLRAQVGPDDVLTLIYTSGTTGEPKGCVLTQRNYAAVVEMVDRIEGLVVRGDVLLLFLPLAHSFARTCQYVATTLGTTAFCADAAAVPAALRAVRPTVLPAAPRVFERVHAAVIAGFRRETGPRRRLVDWAVRTGRRAAARRREGRRPRGALRARTAVASRLVFHRVQARLGGRLRHAISGGAALGPDVPELFDALGILVLEGYGLTECPVVSVNRPGSYRFGTVGPPLPGIEVRVAGDGELLVRGESVFRGYWRDEEATRAALAEDGWLRTGDLVEADADGFLTIVERKKDIIVTAGGKNVAPQKVEAALKASPVVANALVLGDERPFVAALVAVDREQAAGFSGEELRAEVERAVAAANGRLGRDEQVRRFAILDRDFSEEEGELTPTLKLKRRVCEEHFRAEIERLYAGARPST
jgi:long-chain acyl-CoA synthetase